MNCSPPPPVRMCNVAGIVSKPNPAHQLKRSAVPVSPSQSRTTMPLRPQSTPMFALGAFLHHVEICSGSFDAVLCPLGANECGCFPACLQSGFVHMHLRVAGSMPHTGNMYQPNVFTHHSAYVSLDCISTHMHMVHMTF